MVIVWHGVEQTGGCENNGAVGIKGTAKWGEFRAAFFFFQAEDGIRDIGVTGVQTCALPISDYRLGQAIVFKNKLINISAIINCVCILKFANN